MRVADFETPGVAYRCHAVVLNPPSPPPISLSRRMLVLQRYEAEIEKMYEGAAVAGATGLKQQDQ